MSASALIVDLEKHGIKTFIEGDRVKVKLPCPPEQAPAEAKILLRELKQRTDEALAYLQARAAGRVVQLYRMRDRCQAAGHCLALTVEQDCGLYPVRLGWCRERV